MGYIEAIERMKQPERKPKAVKKPWLKAWQDLARLTYGIEREDARLGPVLEALNQCDLAFYADSWTAFEVAVAEVKAAVKGGKE